MGVCVLNDLFGQRDVLFIRQGGTVDHHGGETAVDAALAGLEIRTVVKVQRDGKTGLLLGSFDQLDKIGVVRVGTRALGNLQDQRRIQLFRRFGDALDDLHVVDVERADGIAALVGVFEHFGGGD